jgi:GWxTD domain-containing protein
MIFFACVMMAAAAGSPAVAAVDSQVDSPLVIRAVRFYRNDVQRTRVVGLVQIPLSAISRPDDPAGDASYSAKVRVADSTGLTLYEQAWSSKVPRGAAGTNGYTVEILDFAVANGRYKMDVQVEDSLSGRKMSSSTSIDALVDSTAASDLLLAPQIRLVDQTDTVPRAGEFRNGNSLVTAAAEVMLTPLRPLVYYLMEAYAKAPQDGTMTVSVAGADGAPITKTKPTAVTVDAGKSTFGGKLDLAGLPPGTYTLNADLTMGGRTIHRSAQLVMAGLSETLASDTARRAEARTTDEGYFAEMNPAQLETAKAPLIYLAESGELSPWSNKLSVDAKRRFLTQFWQKRDPTPGTPQNERRESFYKAIDYANTAFREGGRNPQSGWRSDRGRIYAKFGTPADVYKRQQEGRAPPYEVWSYAKGKGSYYIFADRSGFGAYSLIYSDDLKESNLPGWGELLGAPALEDIGRRLGVDLVAAAHGRELRQ